MSTEIAKKRLILLDAHAIIHRAYHALPDFSSSKGEPTGALYGISSMMIKIIEDLKPDYIVAAYDLKGPTYRHEAFKDYKAHRKATEVDLEVQLERSRDIFGALNIPIYDKEGFEADDILGTIVEVLTKGIGRKIEAVPLEIIIASGDMDTLQLVKGKEVRVFTLKRGISDTVMYDEKAVRDRFGFGPELIPDYKGLRGDPSDNIPGVKGIGEKTAGTLIQNFGTIENIYKELESGTGKDGQIKAFEKAGVKPRIVELLKEHKEEAEFSKMLATIRRDAPIDFVMPYKTFNESIDVKKIGGLWRDLEFRTLLPRFEKVLAGPSKIVMPVIKLEDVRSLPAGSHGKEGKMAKKTETAGSKTTALPLPVDTADLEKTALALWLVDSNKTNPSIEDILAFANTDSYEIAKAAIFAELEKRNVKKVYDDIELPLIPVLHKMEKRGVKIDRALLKDLSKKYHVELARLEKSIWKEAGMEFNINSPKQLGEVLFDKLQIKIKNQRKTAGGARSTKESELEKMRDLHPVVPMIFEYRELAKLLGTYIDAIPPLLDDNDRVHTHFIQTGSATGRMASQNPGVQNIPIKSELGRAIRQAFIAEKGFKLISLDYSQIELRIAAFMSGDEKLIEIFRKGEDVHTSVASYVFRVPKNEVTTEMRRQAKVINFGIIYGMGVLALKQNLGPKTTREAAQNFYNEYFSTFNTLAQYLDNIKSETARRGYTETFFGRRRYFEGIKSKIPYIRASAERMAINAPIQGSEADVIKIAMKHVDEYIEREGLGKDVFALLQVHDELVYEVREDKAKEVAEKIEKIMESVIDPSKTKGVIMKAEYAIGDNWNEMS